MKTSPTIGELAKALSKAQVEMKGAKKDSDNPFHKSKYADFAACKEAAQEALSNNGLSVSQPPNNEGCAWNEVGVETILMHSESGEYISSNFKIITSVSEWQKDQFGKQLRDLPKVEIVTPQTVGSALTYARRYAYMGILCLAPEDDDGNIASNKQPEKQAPLRQQQRPQQAKPQPQHPLNERQEQANQLAIEITRYISTGTFTQAQVKEYAEIASISDLKASGDVEKLEIALEKLRMKLSEIEGSTYLFPQERVI